MERVRVLLVDDYEPIREAVGCAFGLEDLQVVGETGDGDVAIDLVLRLDPDVVLTDIVHPGLDGFELIRRIRQDAPHVNVVVYTAYDDAECITRSLALGADGFVSKGESLHVLAEVVEAVASGQRTLSPRARRCWKSGRYGIGSPHR